MCDVNVINLVYKNWLWTSHIVFGVLHPSL